MDTLSAFAIGMANQGREQRVFDWNKAAKIIRDNKPQEASAGLVEDWEWTGGSILENGVPAQDTYTYLSSNWATPAINIDGDVIECWLMEGAVPAEWGEDYAHIYWPESALQIAFPEGNVTRKLLDAPPPAAISGQ